MKTYTFMDAGGHEADFEAAIDNTQTVESQLQQAVTLIQNKKAVLTSTANVRFVESMGQVRYHRNEGSTGARSLAPSPFRRLFTLCFRKRSDAHASF